jgi:hypothetical protein
MCVWVSATCSIKLCCQHSSHDAQQATSAAMMRMWLVQHGFDSRLIAWLQGVRVGNACM